MNKVELTKLVANFAVGAVANKVVKDFMTNQTSSEIVQNTVAGVAGAVVMMKTQKYTDQIVENFFRRQKTVGS